MAKQRKKHNLEVVSQNTDDHKAFAGKNFSPHHLVSFTPKTYPQEQFFNSYYQEVPVILQVGSAGTGKTACALYAALSQVMDRSTVYEKVVLVRSAVQARDIGFVPGDADEKAQIFEAPYEALCDELLSFKSNNYKNLKAKNLLEFHNTSFLRGQTFDNAIIVVDEFQSMTYHEMSTVLTRTGINSRIVFCGDHKQCDLHKRNDKSGFSDFMRVIERMPSSSVDVVVYKPEDIVRSGICKDFLVAEEEEFSSNM